MGSDATEVAQVPKNSYDVKAHSSICWVFREILDRIGCILPAIESSRPGCMSGIKELCSLYNTIEKAKLLLQHCAESSKLYLAITAEATLHRCERIRAALDQSLCEIQNMVPQLLAVQISDIASYVRDARFIIDSEYEEAGKSILELLRQTEANNEMEFGAFQFAALRLKITCSKALLIERRSVKKLLDKIHGNDPKKERILGYFLYLLKKYGNKVKPDGNEQTKNPTPRGMISSTYSKCNTTMHEINDDPTSHTDARTGFPSSDVPPEEFCCPISSRLMYDPVVISSGKTYERTCIEAWFNEGNDTCPKTQKKLENLSVIPNTCMNDLITHWCKKHSLDIQDLCPQPNLVTSCSWEPSHCNSISSLKNVSAALLDGNSRDQLLQSDNRSILFVSSDAISDLSHVESIKKSKDNHTQTFPWSDDYQKCHSFCNFSHDMFLRFFDGLSELPLELQGKAVEDLKSLSEDDETCYAMLSNGFDKALLKFLKDTTDYSDVSPRRIGSQILLSFLSNNRVEIPSLNEDAFQFLTSFLDSEITTETLVIMQKMAHHKKFVSYIEASGIPSSLVKILDSGDTVFLELAVKILYDLSFHSEIKSHILSSGCMSRLVLFLNDISLLEICINIIRNLCETEEGAMMIAKTDGYLASIAEVLESGTRKEQQHAVAILHSLCSRRFEYCQLVLEEGVIPSLVYISMNGNREGKECSAMLLCLLRDFSRHSNC